MKTERYLFGRQRPVEGGCRASNPVKPSCEGFAGAKPVAWKE